MERSAKKITGSVSDHTLFLGLHHTDNQENKIVGMTKFIFHTHENYINPRFLNFTAGFAQAEMQISGLWV
jgi:hypothetical protein